MKLLSSKNSDGEHSQSGIKVDDSDKVVSKSHNFISNAEFEQYINLQEELKECETKMEKLNAKAKLSTYKTIKNVAIFSTLYSALGICLAKSSETMQDFAPLLAIPACVLGVASTYALEKFMQSHYEKKVKCCDDRFNELKYEEKALYLKKLNENIARTCAFNDEFEYENN